MCSEYASGNGYTHKTLTYCSFKTSKPPRKIKILLYILYILNKKTVTAENRSTVLDTLFLLDMSIFDKLVNKNDLVKKETPFFTFMEGVHLPTAKSWYQKSRRFHRKFYRKSKFNILVNFDFVLSTS